MLTIFSIPKPFVGESALIQRNALASWRSLGEDVEIVLFGSEPGTAEAASAAGARHVPELERNEHGTPLVGAAFAQARAIGTAPTLVYVNADVVFLPDLRAALSRLRLEWYLLVGRRRDIDADRLDVGAPGWEERAASAADSGAPGSPFQIDYFAFPRTIDWAMPGFAVGRPAWDSWLVQRARSLGVPVIDASRAVTALHQRHGYAHVPSRSGDAWEGPEAAHNRELAGPGGHRWSILDATHVLDERGVRRARGGEYLRRRLFLLGERWPSVGRAVAAGRRLRRR